MRADSLGAELAVAVRGAPPLVCRVRQRGRVAPSAGPRPRPTATQQRRRSPPPGSLDNSSPVTSKPDAFFSELKDFREANKEECIHSDPE